MSFDLISDRVEMGGITPGSESAISFTSLAERTSLIRELRVCRRIVAGP